MLMEQVASVIVLVGFVMLIIQKRDPDGPVR